MRAAWQGATLDQVAAAWGAPATSVKDGAQETHTWVSVEQSGHVGGGPTIGIGVGGGRGGVGVGVGGGMIFGGGGIASRCDRTLVFRAGRVAEQSWNGPPEYCARFARP